MRNMFFNKLLPTLSTRKDFSRQEIEEFYKVLNKAGIVVDENKKVLPNFSLRLNGKQVKL